MITRIEIEDVDVTTFSSARPESVTIGATAHGTTGNDNITLNFDARLNVTELAQLKALLETVETRIRADLGVSQQ